VPNDREKKTQEGETIRRDPVLKMKWIEAESRGLKGRTDGKCRLYFCLSSREKEGDRGGQSDERRKLPIGKAGYPKARKVRRWRAGGLELLRLLLPCWKGEHK